MSRENNQELLQLHPGLLLLLQVTPAQLTWTEHSQEQESPEQVHVKIPAQKAPPGSFQVLVKHRRYSYSRSCLQPGPWAAMPTEGGVRRQKLPKFSAASQRAVQFWTCSPANSTFRSSGKEKHYLRPKVGLEFYFRIKGLRKACSLSNTSNAQKAPPWLNSPSPGRWDPSFLLWDACPYLPELQNRVSHQGT